MKKLSLLFAAFLLVETSAFSQKDQLCKIWYNQEKDSKVEVFQTGNTFQAKVVWLKEPMLNGKPKLDIENPEEKLRSRPVIGLVFLYNLKKSDDDKKFLRRRKNL